MKCPKCGKEMPCYEGPPGSEIRDYECEKCGIWVEEAVME